MRNLTLSEARLWGVAAGFSLALVLSLGAGCAPQKSVKPTPPPYEVTPVPTVPPKPPKAPDEPKAADEAKPASEGEALKLRPVGKAVEAKPGQPIGPVITFLGAARADGLPVKPAAVDKSGVPTYTSIAGSGFILVIEAKPGLANYEVGRRLYAYVEDDPTVRGDLEIISSRDLGDGSKQVCDRQRPNIGGIPGITPPSFEETQPISDAINDFACRFETFTESDFSCTMDEREVYSFVDSETAIQFCLIVARAYGFPEGTTELSVRIRDIKGNPGPVKKLRINRPKGHK